MKFSINKYIVILMRGTCFEWSKSDHWLWCKT